MKNDRCILSADILESFKDEIGSQKNINLLKNKQRNDLFSSITNLTNELNHEFINRLKQENVKYLVTNEDHPEWLDEVFTVFSSINVALKQRDEGVIFVTSDTGIWREKVEISPSTNSWEKNIIKFDRNTTLSNLEYIEREKGATIITVTGNETHRINIELQNIHINGEDSSRGIYTEYANIRANGEIDRGCAENDKGGAISLGQSSEAKLNLDLYGEAYGGGALYMTGSKCILEGGISGSIRDIVGLVYVDGESQLEIIGDINGYENRNGGIYISKNSVVRMRGNIQNCQVCQSGGGVQNFGGIFDMEGDISYCYAFPVPLSYPIRPDHGGGAICTHSGGQSSLKGNIISCGLTVLGGALYTESQGEMYMEGDIQTSRAQRGGGVYNAGKTTIKGSIINCGNDVGRYITTQGAAIFTASGGKTKLIGDVINIKAKEGVSAVFTDYRGQTYVERIINGGNLPVEGKGITEVNKIIGMSKSEQALLIP